MNFSSAFASPLGLFPELKSELSLSISKEEFNSFHSIDRTLYSLLIQTLGKAPSDSLRVMGFWLFLEHDERNLSGLVKTLSGWPLNSINEVFNESLSCLRHMQDGYLSIEKSDYEELFFLSKLLKTTVSKMCFVKNRCIILSKVEHQVNHVCIKAFQDIPQNPPHQVMISSFSGMSNENGFTNLSNGTRVIVPTRSPSIVHPKTGTGVFVPRIEARQAIRPNVFCAPPPFQTHFPAHHYQSQVVEDSTKGDKGKGYFCNSNEEINSYPTKFSSNHGYYFSMNKNSGEMVEENQVEEVMADDRTIFLTFSKGYPLTEIEVREFFTRRFGDFIESIEMHEVENGEQALFAKVVSKSIEMVEVVVNGGKAKYHINKKHVCARKFIALSEI